MRLQAELVDQLDLSNAVERELTRPPKNLPSRAIEDALADRVEEASTWLDGRFRSDFQPAVAETIWASKFGNGYRPLTALSFEERVLYRALVDKIAARVDTRPRGFKERERIHNAPLTVTGTRFVVLADISSFYEYVDHDLLTDEVVAQTGEIAFVEACVELLQQAMDRRFGLPQLYEPSDVLSEIVVDVAERRLQRDDWRVFRYTDDFRISAGSYQEALHALEALHDALRPLGLVLNDSKSYPVSRAKYKKSSDQADELWSEITDQVEADLANFDWYSGTVELGADDEDDQERDVWITAASRALELWAEDLKSHAKGDWLAAQVARRLLGRALSPLMRYRSPNGLPYLSEIIRREPQLTPAVARYLNLLATPRRSGVLDSLGAVVNDASLYLSPWQALWLFGPLLSMKRLPAGTRDWLRSYLNGKAPSIVQARAAYVLAQHRAIDPDDLVSMYRTMSGAARPDVVAAAASIIPRNDRRLKGIRSNSPMDRWIVDSVTDGS